MKKRKRIVITGIGMVSPYGRDKSKFWSSIKNGNSAIREVSSFDVSKFAYKKAALVPDFNFNRLLKKRSLSYYSRSSLFALLAAEYALKDAGVECPVENRLSHNFGVAMGISLGPMENSMAMNMEVKQTGPRSISPMAFPNVSPNVSAGHISIEYNIKGFNTTLTNPVSSGLDALFYGSTMIRDHGYKVVLAGATEELTEIIFEGFSYIKSQSGRNTLGGKEKIICPYDKRRDGAAAGEGSCLFVLEELASAKKRGAKIYAEVKGFGTSFAADEKSDFVFSKESAVSSMAQAIKGTESPIDCIFGSANSTKKGDHIEAMAIEKNFGASSQEIPVTSIKSMIGDTLSASGPFNIAAAVNTLKSGEIPPTAGYLVPDKRCPLNVSSDLRKKKNIKNIMINAFGYTGFSSSLVIGSVN